jgi:hypothetical protein
VQLGGERWLAALELDPEQLGEEVVDAVPAAAVVEREQEQVVRASRSSAAAEAGASSTASHSSAHSRSSTEVRSMKRCSSGP